MINDRTSWLLEKEKGREISETPLHVVIKKKDYMNLTLIDLPGLTYSQKKKNPEEEKTIDVIRRMIKTQIKDPKCIILLVVAADVDIGNTEAVEMAQELDPLKQRTMLVINKADWWEVNFHKKFNQNELGLILG